MVKYNMKMSAEWTVFLLVLIFFAESYTTEIEGENNTISTIDKTSFIQRDSTISPKESDEPSAQAGDNTLANGTILETNLSVDVTLQITPKREKEENLHTSVALSTSEALPSVTPMLLNTESILFKEPETQDIAVTTKDAEGIIENAEQNTSTVEQLNNHEQNLTTFKLEVSQQNIASTTEQSHHVVEDKIDMTEQISKNPNVTLQGTNTTMRQNGSDVLIATKELVPNNLTEVVRLVDEVQTESMLDVNTSQIEKASTTLTKESNILKHPIPRKNVRKTDIDESQYMDNNTLFSNQSSNEDNSKKHTTNSLLEVASKSSTNATQNKTKYITLLLQKNCTSRNLIPNTIAVLNKHMLNLLTMSTNDGVSINSVGCHTFVHLKFSVEKVRDDVLKQATEILSSNVTLGNDYKIIKAYVSQEDSDTSDVLETLLFTENDQEEPFRLHGEMIAYIVASFCCAFVLLLFIILCCIRCFGTRQTNSHDLCDIPHLNLKLEDYKIMPIPRPSISYNDYGRELLNSTYGGSRSGDTLVSHHKYAGDGSSSLGNTLRREAVMANQELRTFNGKRACVRVQSLDIQPHQSVSSWVSESREKLNSELERKRLSGIDNASFEKWC